MSFAIDVNILLYASDVVSPHGKRAQQFLRGCVTSGEVFALAWTTIMSYLRIATHPGVFANPLSPERATRNIEALLDAPHLRVLCEQEGFWSVYKDVAARLPLRGNLVPDAHLAALLKQHGIRILYTNDSDFLRFSFLSVRNPFA